MFTDPLAILSLNIQGNIEHVCGPYKCLKVTWTVDKWLHSGSLSLLTGYSEKKIAMLEVIFLRSRSGKWKVVQGKKLKLKPEISQCVDFFFF